MIAKANVSKACTRVRAGSRKMNPRFSVAAKRRIVHRHSAFPRVRQTGGSPAGARPASCGFRVSLKENGLLF